MKRRTCLQAMMAASLGVAASKAQGPRPIQLHVDLTVPTTKEKDMLRHFETIFRPTAAKQSGYIDVKMLKLRTALMGKAPAGVNYRFNLTFQSEELRQKWIKSDDHQRVWPPLENMLTHKDYIVILFDTF